MPGYLFQWATGQRAANLEILAAKTAAKQRCLVPGAVDVISGTKPPAQVSCQLAELPDKAAICPSWNCRVPKNIHAMLPCPLLCSCLAAPKCPKLSFP